LLKVSAAAASLRAEAAHLAALRDLGVGLSVARLFACAEAIEGDDRWMAYLMEPVGEMSLRDYLFTATPLPGKFLDALGQGLTALYCRTARTTTRNFAEEYLRSIRQSLDKAKGYATFAALRTGLESALFVKGTSLTGPGAIASALEQRAQQGDAAWRALNPTRDCHVHGDLHFENVRINPSEANLGLYWLIDPKEFDRGDYVYDLAKLMTSLTGHAHADIGENETGNPRLKWTDAGDGRIDFNCVLTPRQVQGWREGLAAIEKLAVNVAPQLEMAGASGSAEAEAEAIRRMKQRLLLALARHHFSAVRFFLMPRAQWLLFARGTQFLAMFQASLAGRKEEEWDPFRVCAGDQWMETV
jgi:aminoglycoside phosphotransferase (APT) family kinase protein